MTNNLEIEIKKYNNGYSFSSEDNDRKRIYSIHLPELKKKIREIISPYGIVGKGNIQYEGKNSQGDRIIYQQGKDNLPDQLTLMSREIVEKQEINANKSKFETEFQEFEDELKKSEVEWKQTKEKWQKVETELGISSGGEKHYFSSRKNDGTIGMEGMYIKSETQSHLITLENKGNSPQIKEITDKETKQKKTDESPTNSNKQDQQTEKETNQQNLSQKIDNKDNNNKKVFYGIGAVSLVVLMISILVVWVKKKK